MRRSWSAFLLAGALALLGSLYLPWQEASCGPGCVRGLDGDVTGFLNFFAGSLTVDGWSSGIGEAVALFALLLAGAALVGLARPHLASRLPLDLCALFAGYFGLALAAQARSVADQREVGLNGIDFGYAYGAYLGVAGAVVVLLTAFGMRRSEFERDRSTSRLVLLALVAGLLVALLLPWGRFAGPARVTFLGIASPAAVVAAPLALCLPFVWWRREVVARVGRVVLSTGALLFTGAAVSSLEFPTSHAYGAWIGLAVAVALVGFALMEDAWFARLERPTWYALATGGAATLLIAGLFLPWQKACYATGSGLGPYSGRCISSNGWTTTVGVVSGVLAIALILVSLAPQFTASFVELAGGLGLVVATLGFQLTTGGGSDLSFEFGYGSTIGFVGAAILVALAVVRLRPPGFDWNRVAIRLVPIVACVAYLVVVVLPWWDLLPRRLESALRFAPLSWLTIVGALLGIHLLRVWVQQIAGARQSVDSLVLLPLALLALAALDLIRLRDDGITWGGGIILGLCLLLALLGRAEEQEGLENTGVPEILRVDRL